MRAFESMVIVFEDRVDLVLFKQWHPMVSHIHVGAFAVP